MLEQITVTRTGCLLLERLDLIYEWYKGMIGHEEGMLAYVYSPEDDRFAQDSSPLRQIAAVWDVGVLSDFLGRSDLAPLMDLSMRRFVQYLFNRGRYMILDPNQLGEPSTIAHSAFMILAMLHASPHRISRQILALAEGIVRQQRSDGSYKVYFGDLADHGQELYGGQAMLALMEVYRQTQDPRYFQSAERGFGYYDRNYYQQGRVAENLLVYFADWQSQACRLLFDHGQDPGVKQEVGEFVCRMQDQLIHGGFYESVGREPARHTSLQVACALEGLNEAYAIARASRDKRATDYRRRICSAIGFLGKLQSRKSGNGRGGVGLSIRNAAQRIDIAGHVAGGFMKTAANEIDCHPPAR